MDSKYWIKLQHSLLDDPRVGWLSDTNWRHYIELLLFAGIENKDGRLPAVFDMAWRLRVDSIEFTECVTQLETVGLLERNDDDEWQVIGFERTQAPSEYTLRKQSAYQMYLQSEHWKAIRNMALDRASYKCQKCGNQSDLQVHHLSYDNLGHETYDDVMVLCRDCHQEEHGYD